MNCWLLPTQKPVFFLTGNFPRLTGKKMANSNQFVLVNLKWLDVQLFQIRKFYAHLTRHGFIRMTLSTVKLPDTRFSKELREIIK